MKIKKLKIRNIASIEAADIDFEKDLMDAGTGLPASMFLISGDTGTGKSVILDCISMALYGTTPRIAAILGKNDNKYRNAEGQQVKINAIEQYTRLGITEKDECYSELVFEGNDGLEYTSKFKLGVLRGNTDKNTGERYLKYRTPEMSVSVGSQSYFRGEAHKKIEEAVGLTFEQFGRMAMLAQGQFAAFLTGDKKERELILEQLTNTEHFSRYGEAIKRLFNKARSAKDEAQTVYDTEKGHTLPQEELDALKQQLEEAEKNRNENDGKISENGRRLDEMKKYETAVATLRTESEKKKNLEQAVKSDEYSKAKKLAADWESTVTERQRLQDLRDAGKNLDAAKTKEQDLAKTFHTLDADLAFRRQQADDREAALKDKQSWLEARKDRDAMYGHAGETLLKMNNYEHVLTEMAGLTEKQKIEDGKTQGLVDAAAEKNRLVQEAKKAVDDKQGEIDALIRQRDALDLENTNKELEKIRNEMTALNLLINEIAACTDAEKACGDLRNEITEDEKKRKALDEKLQNAGTAYETAKTARDIARNCYTTMSSSLEDTLVNLRQQLVEENETICPLCGQKIEKITDDFKGRLTELGQLRKEADDRFTKAKEEYEVALGVQKQFSGALDRKKEDLQRKEEALKRQKDNISRKAREVGLETGDGLEKRIQARQTELSVTEAGLKATQQKAEDLQKRISAHIKEKTPLQEAYESARQEVSAAEQAVKDNAMAISNLKKTFDEKATSKTNLFAEISEAVSRFYPEWADALPATKEQLKTDADAYGKCKESARTEATELGKLRDKLQVMGEFRDGIAKSYADWAADVLPVEYQCRDIVAEWRELYRSAETHKTEVAGYTKTISECEKVLMQWYEHTCRDEKALDAIAGSAKDIEAARRLVKNTDEELKSAADAVTLASGQRDDAMRALGAESVETLPARADLEKEKEDLALKNNDLVGLIADISGKLSKNTENVQLLEKQAEELKRTTAVFEKWNLLNGYFGGTRFRTLVQTYILRPLLNNANLYLKRITDRYKLTCSEENEQLSILVLDRYNKDQIRSVAVLSGGERFMISLALSLALSSLNRADMNVNILFIDEGFGTLDANTLESVMGTLEKLQEIAGESNRRVGIISHREELEGRVPTQIKVVKKGEGKSQVEIIHQ